MRERSRDDRIAWSEMVPPAYTSELCRRRHDNFAHYDAECVELCCLLRTTTHARAAGRLHPGLSQRGAAARGRRRALEGARLTARRRRGHTALNVAGCHPLRAGWTLPRFPARYPAAPMRPHVGERSPDRLTSGPSSANLFCSDCPI